MPGARDNFRVEAGEILSGRALIASVRSRGLALGTHLRPQNLLELVELGDPNNDLATYSSLDAATRASMLAEVLADTGVYPSRIVEACAHRSRVDFVPRNARAVSFVNGPVVVSGLTAVPAPWLIAWAATKLEISPGDRALVLGSGTGHVMRVFLDLVGEHGEVVGVERSSELVEFSSRVLRENGYMNATLVHGDVFDHKLQLGQFDAVWASLSCERLLGLWESWLAQSGRLACFLPPAKAEKLEQNWWHNCDHPVVADGRVVAKLQNVFNPQFASPSADLLTQPESGYYSALDHTRRLNAILSAS